MKYSWLNALLLEQKVARIISEQERTGVKFNTIKARFLVHAIEERCLHIESGILNLFTPKPIPIGTPILKPFTKTGVINARAVRYLDDQSVLLGGPFSPITYQKLKLSQREKLADELIRLGWKPTSYTDKGKPQLVVKGNPCPNLETVGDIGKDLAMWFKLKHRQSQIKGLISNVREDGRIPACANSLATPTGRMRHSVIVNIPKAEEGVVLGKEMRSLFISNYPETTLIGYDAKALEARMEAHYTYPYDNGEYARELLEGDIHTKNTFVFYGDILSSIDDPLFKYYRGKSKSGKYGLTYGCLPPRLADTLGVDLNKGQKLYDDFWNSNKTLHRLLVHAQKSALRGYLVGIDGRKIFLRQTSFKQRWAEIGGCRYDNPLGIKFTDALNYLFQSAGAIVMKYTMCYLDDWLVKYKLDGKCRKIIDVHDECQLEVINKPEIISQVKELCLEAMVKSGKILNINVPLEGDVKVGRSWDKTH